MPWLGQVQTIPWTQTSQLDWPSCTADLLSSAHLTVWSLISVSWSDAMGSLFVEATVRIWLWFFYSTLLYVEISLSWDSLKSFGLNVKFPRQVFLALLNGNFNSFHWPVFFLDPTSYPFSWVGFFVVPHFSLSQILPGLVWDLCLLSSLLWSFVGILTLFWCLPLL